MKIFQSIYTGTVCTLHETNVLGQDKKHLPGPWGPANHPFQNPSLPLPPTQGNRSDLQQSSRKNVYTFKEARGPVTSIMGWLIVVGGWWHSAEGVLPQGEARLKWI